MSKWTHVFGTIKVTAYGSCSKAETAFIVDTILYGMPKLSENENEVEIHYHVVDKVKQWSNTNRWNQENKKAPGDNDCYEVPNQAIVTIDGDFRSTEFQETLQRVAKFLFRLSERIGVENLIVQVSDDFDEKTFLFDKSTNDWLGNYDAENEWREEYLHITSDYWEKRLSEENN